MNYIEYNHGRVNVENDKNEIFVPTELVEAVKNYIDITSLFFNDSTYAKKGIYESNGIFNQSDEQRHATDVAQNASERKLRELYGTFGYYSVHHELQRQTDILDIRMMKKGYFAVEKQKFYTTSPYYVYESGDSGDTVLRNEYDL